MESWKINKRKSLRNTGHAYTTRKEKMITGKVFTYRICSCRLKCSSKITEEHSRKLFDSFWKLGDYSQQNVYLRGTVQSFNVQRKRSRNGSGYEKSTSFKYFLQVENQSMQVCKLFFLNTLQISDGRLYRCLSKPDVFAAVDSRGKKTPGNKIDDTDVINHIKSFPAYLLNT